MIDAAFLTACAPTVAPATTAAIVRVESGANPLALNINGARLPRLPRSPADAAALARAYIRAGYSVDLGLMQVNSRNLAALGESVEGMFEPCRNLAAGARVLSVFYDRARRRYADPQTALRAALSAYNTGNFVRGFVNGYVARYDRHGAPARRAGRLAVALPIPRIPTVRVPSPDPYTVATTVRFHRFQEPPMNPTPPPSFQSAPDDTRAFAPARVTAVRPVISRSATDFHTPGVQVEVDPEEATALGAFEESALSEADAWDANTHAEPLAPSPASAGGTAVVARAARVH